MNFKRFTQETGEILQCNAQNFALFMIENARKVPGININREKFLRKELVKYYPEVIINEAIKTTPFQAGIPVQIINKIADGCIKYERFKTTAAAAGCGVPGAFSGPAFAALIASDTAQYYGHIMRIMQKLLYLYGFKDISKIEDELDDETKYKLLVFFGIMCGAETGTHLLTEGAKFVGQNINWYKFIKPVASQIGLKITKEGTSKAIFGKIIPVAGAFINGTLTYNLFSLQAKKLKNYLIGWYGKGFLLTDISRE